MNTPLLQHARRMTRLAVEGLITVSRPLANGAESQQRIQDVRSAHAEYERRLDEGDPEAMEGAYQHLQRCMAALTVEAKS